MAGERSADSGGVCREPASCEEPVTGVSSS